MPRVRRCSRHTQRWERLGPCCITSLQWLRWQPRRNALRTLPAAGALFGPVGIGVGAALYLGQKMFKSIPDAFDTLLKREYTITGSWESPEITRL